jgi:hypothetical protein
VAGAGLPDRDAGGLAAVRAGPGRDAGAVHPLAVPADPRLDGDADPLLLVGCGADRGLRRSQPRRRLARDLHADRHHRRGHPLLARRRSYGRHGICRRADRDRSAADGGALHLAGARAAGL